MPNGDSEDTRHLWQRVKDMEKELRQERQRVSDLKHRVRDLVTDKDALLVSLKLLRKEGE